MNPQPDHRAEKAPDMLRKDAGEYGWLTISPEEYAKLEAHGYAGIGTPTDPTPKGTVWVISREPEGTVLWTGVVVRP